MNIRIVDRLCHDKDALRAAYTAAQTLIANKWNDWPAPSWDEPAVLAFAEGQCVAGINWSVEEKMRKANIDFAFCDKAYPTALAAVLLAFRKKMVESGALEISFCCHPDNGPMMKLVEKLRLQPRSLSYRIPTAEAGRTK